MGGRGGSSAGVKTASPNETGPSAQFWEWASSDRPMHADYVGEGRVRLNLPDTGAYMRREGSRYVVHEDGTDRVLFTNTHSVKGLWNEISAHYGGRIEVSVDPGERTKAPLGMFGKEYGRKSSPAARKYGAR